MSSRPKLQAEMAGDLRHLLGQMHFLAENVPARTAIRQVEALFVIAHANAMGHSITISEVVEAIDPTGGGRALERSIHAFTSPNKFYPDALGWIDQETDPDDRRKKYLVLTDKGAAAIEALLAVSRRTAAT